MTRHGKNCTAGAVYTYHEKKKDTAASGYGTQNIRLSRDAVKDFDCCCLSLQPCHDPVVTPDGYLYDREAILEYILHQKKEVARQMKVTAGLREAAGRPAGGAERAAAGGGAGPGAGLPGEGGGHREPAPQPLHAQGRLGDRPRRCPSRAQRGPRRQGQRHSAAQLLDPVADPRGQGHQAGEAVAHRDLPDVGEAAAHVGPDARALHAPRRLRGSRGAHHAQRALRVRRDPRQPEQRNAVRRAAALWGRGHPRVRGEAHSEGHGGPGERGEAHGPRHHRAAAGRHRLRGLWSEAAGRKVQTGDAGLSAGDQINGLGRDRPCGAFLRRPEPRGRGGRGAGPRRQRWGAS
ncbi:PREDICTED: nitric oxide synthase-interacting protein isoform X1 [Ceratotherium simum simum]|uniref:Nitric oxide synthase-interacting protein n=1 Tax=Ceratotherium simum simum TaxID=73337 RepID=A0ABM1DG15_CERSS|nr:PREDICTED: nitric oxide synthase-interacting protein isoform X1 [Ceratotherium simum simum]XP_014650747.1 PREDICTED: nitric oxide synthase-interacting protein isoform X1 [Ceratotherium simum simum]XP_014650748.1 PREDICTED: nitric oxide synthase-interacting protein isoform X1 [Ceratotherium simum simum]